MPPPSIRQEKPLGQKERSFRAYPGNVEGTDHCSGSGEIVQSQEEEQTRETAPKTERQRKRLKHEDQKEKE